MAYYCLAMASSMASIHHYRLVSSSSTNNTSTNTTRMEAKKAEDCPSYGCPLLPQDVYYNQPVKEALAKLRRLKRDEVPDKGSSSNKQNPTEEHFQILHSSGTKESATLTLIGYKGGSLESQVNQDRAFCVSPYELNTTTATTTTTTETKGQQKNTGNDNTNTKNRILGVFDGHAHLGELVSQYTVTELPKLLAKKIQSIDGNQDPKKKKKEPTKPPTQEQIKQALTETFIEIDRTAPAETSGGCTASIVLQLGSKVYFANAGDSRSFLVLYRAKSQKVEVIYITREDKPHLKEERERVEKMGGTIYIGHGSSRVLYVDPESGFESGLAMSRSIGDWECGKVGVIPDPIVHVIDISKLVEEKLLADCQVLDSDEGVVDPECLIGSDDIYIFAVCATDGLMDFCTPEGIGETVAVGLYDKEGPHLLTALEELIYYAAQGWEQVKQGMYRDDIAIAVSQLRIPPSPPRN